MVTCDPDDSQSHFKERPSLVVEVLSPNTESTDRREKMLAYRTLPSLREYVLVATDKRQVEIYRRDEHDEWQLAVANDHGKKAVINYETAMIVSLSSILSRKRARKQTNACASFMLMMANFCRWKASLVACRWMRFMKM